MQLEPLLALSTVHLSRETCDALAIYPNAWPLVIYPNDYGAFVHVSELKLLTVDGLPKDLARVVQFASERRISWIKFDADAQEIEGLPTYRNTWDMSGGSGDPPVDVRA